MKTFLSDKPLCSSVALCGPLCKFFRLVTQSSQRITENHREKKEQYTSYI